MARDFNMNDAGSVSVAEMNYAPLQTVQIIAQTHGWEWASRLWEYWHHEYIEPHQFGIVACELHDKSRKVREWLDQSRPKEQPRADLPRSLRLG